MDTAASGLSFDIKIPEGNTVEFRQEVTFENFVGQFQPYCAKLLCVIDGTILHYYDKKGPLPTNLRFDYKQRRRTLTEYYFRSIDTDTLYCVFGREAARIIYPRIDEVDPEASQEASSKINTAKKLFRPPIVQPIKSPKLPLFREQVQESTRIASSIPEFITIVDKGVKLTFPNPNYPVEVRTYYPS